MKKVPLDRTWRRKVRRPPKLFGSFKGIRSDSLKKQTCSDFNNLIVFLILFITVKLCKYCASRLYNLQGGNKKLFTLDRQQEWRPLSPRQFPLESWDTFPDSHHPLHHHVCRRFASFSGACALWVLEPEKGDFRWFFRRYYNRTIDFEDLCNWCSLACSRELTSNYRNLAAKGNTR